MYENWMSSEQEVVTISKLWPTKVYALTMYLFVQVESEPLFCFFLLSLQTNRNEITHVFVTWIVINILWETVDGADQILCLYVRSAKIIDVEWLWFILCLRTHVSNHFSLSQDTQSYLDCILRRGNRLWELHSWCFRLPSQMFRYQCCSSLFTKFAMKNSSVLWLSFV